MAHVLRFHLIEKPLRGLFDFLSPLLYHLYHSTFPSFWDGFIFCMLSARYAPEGRSRGHSRCCGVLEEAEKNRSLETCKISLPI
jgi:hypothetical protein